MTVREQLVAVSGYPIPAITVEAVANKRGCDLDSVADSETLKSPSFRLALADLFVWLYFAPNVAQGGQSYSFSEEQRRYWRKQARAIYDELVDEEGIASLSGGYGYQGSRL